MQLNGKSKKFGDIFDEPPMKQEPSDLTMRCGSSVCTDKMMRLLADAIGQETFPAVPGKFASG
jgi:hypothetical protein